MIRFVSEIAFLRKVSVVTYEGTLTDDMIDFIENISFDLAWVTYNYKRISEANDIGHLASKNSKPRFLSAISFASKTDVMHFKLRFM